MISRLFPSRADIKRYSAVLELVRFNMYSMSTLLYRLSGLVHFWVFVIVVVSQLPIVVATQYGSGEEQRGTEVFGKRLRTEP
jgi:succinate dehydrogenase/fumarate reductase cytochrome b subunit